MFVGRSLSGERLIVGCWCVPMVWKTSKTIYRWARNTTRSQILPRGIIIYELGIGLLFFYLRSGKWYGRALMTYCPSNLWKRSLAGMHFEKTFTLLFSNLGGSLFLGLVRRLVGSMIICKRPHLNERILDQQHYSDAVDQIRKKCRPRYRWQTFFYVVALCWVCCCLTACTTDYLLLGWDFIFVVCGFTQFKYTPLCLCESGCNFNTLNHMAIFTHFFTTLLLSQQTLSRLIGSRYARYCFLPPFSYPCSTASWLGLVNREGISGKCTLDRWADLFGSCLCGSHGRHTPWIQVFRGKAVPTGNLTTWSCV